MTTESRPQRGSLQNVTAALLGAIVLCRLVTPTEGAVEGETLWIALLCPIALCFWSAVAWWEGTPRLRLNWLDAAVGLLVAGQVIAALSVVFASGDKRAAVNMLWEWLAIGITFFLARQLLRTESSCKNVVLLTIATAVSLSVLGIWQHHVGYAETAQEYKKLKYEWDALHRDGRPDDSAAAAKWDEAVHLLEWRFINQGIPAEQGARMLWEQRLNASTEPFGMFALANTFAGFLAACLVLIIGLTVSRTLGASGTLKLPHMLAGVLAAALVAYCLWLTKSRTAVAGLLAGLLLWVCWRVRQGRPQLSFRVRTGIVAGVVVIGGLIAVAVASGRLESLLGEQAMKSLRYRGEYWTTTWEVLRKSPRNLLLGVGPGNFRQHYLPHKLAESSEEIADPHNLFLDVWANGGVVSLLGLLGICVAICLSFGGSGVEIAKEAQPFEKKRVVETHSAHFLIDAYLAGGAFGFGIAYLVGGAEDLRLPVLLIGWLIALALLGPLMRRAELSAGLCGAAAVALLVHLLGAGGIAMPAITQTLLLLIICGYGDDSRRTDFRVRPEQEGRAGKPVLRVACALVAVALALGCWFTGVEPVRKRHANIGDGDYALSAKGDATTAEAAYLRAAQADSLSSDPYNRLANVSFRRWQQSKGTATDAFDRGVAWQREAIARNPRQFGEYLTLGEWYLAKFERSRDRSDALAAAEEFEQAVTLYPNSPRLQAALAEAWWRAFRISDAQTHAWHAIDLHEINRRAGHVDKLLPEKQFRLMQLMMMNLE